MNIFRYFFFKSIMVNAKSGSHSIILLLKTFDVSRSRGT